MWKQDLEITRLMKKGFSLSVYQKNSHMAHMNINLTSHDGNDRFS